MALVAASFQAASSESLQMMEVSDRLPSTQPSPTREASANVTSNSTPSISQQAANLIANTLQQPTLTQVPSPTSTSDASAQQTQTTNVRSNAVAAANASAARDEAFFAAALKQPLLTQIPSPQPATAAKSSAPQSAPIAAAPTRDQAFFDAALKQPDLSPYATAADNSQTSQQPRVVAKSSAVSSATPVRSEAITDAGLRQPAMNPPSYSVPVAESHAAQPPVAATTAPAPATVAAAPIRSEATSTANLQQPDLSQPTFAPSAVQTPIAQVQPIVTKSAAPQVIAAAPVKADASAVADLKQPEMNRAMPLAPVAESRPMQLRKDAADRRARLKWSLPPRLKQPTCIVVPPTQVAESRVQPMPTPDTKTIPAPPAAAVAIAPPTVAAPGTVRSEPVAVAAPKQSPAVVEARSAATAAVRSVECQSCQRRYQGVNSGSCRSRCGGSAEATRNESTCAVAGTGQDGRFSTAGSTGPRTVCIRYDCSSFADRGRRKRRGSDETDDGCSRAGACSSTDCRRVPVRMRLRTVPIGGTQHLRRRVRQLRRTVLCDVERCAVHSVVILWPWRICRPRTDGARVDLLSPRQRLATGHVHCLAGESV